MHRLSKFKKKSHESPPPSKGKRTPESKLRMFYVPGDGLKFAMFFWLKMMYRILVSWLCCWNSERPIQRSVSFRRLGHFVEGLWLGKRTFPLWKAESDGKDTFAKFTASHDKKNMSPSRIPHINTCDLWLHPFIPRESCRFSTIH